MSSFSNNIIGSATSKVYQLLEFERKSLGSDAAHANRKLRHYKYYTKFAIFHTFDEMAATNSSYLYVVATICDTESQNFKVSLYIRQTNL